VQKVVVDEAVAEGHSKPYIVFKTPEAPAEEPARKVSAAGG